MVADLWETKIEVPIQVRELVALGIENAREARWSLFFVWLNVIQLCGIARRVPGRPKRQPGFAMPTRAVLPFKGLVTSHCQACRHCK